jgi:hypothetical protein
VQTLKHCSVCHTASYCSAPCQRAAWPSHKRACCAELGAFGVEPPLMPLVALPPLSHEFLKARAAGAGAGPGAAGGDKS